ncbi:amidohydrolase family protein [Chitinasiproducens palmae]|uniref:Predicted metal-dependent hydrolase, TIM-barrel fold n=1 Tax=Chitinasiproducens palmae TaxID=1770053 RepID=A0A1H2PMS2_9BURK|nr:amidohydrolase family protein [Chitinasiproducens palmae]SDV47052.1 Predicted metal-dependent hydrolase, TIM-barrel fold [Chitinasiproducens palmae]
MSTRPDTANPPVYDGPIIDAHQHFWEPDKNDYPWLAPGTLIPFRYGNYEAIKGAYLPADLLRDAGHHKIVGTVYMEAEWAPDDALGETRYIHDLAHRTGFPNAMIAQAWLDHPDAHEALRQQAQFPLVRSVRHKPGGAGSPEAARSTKSLMVNDAWRRGYSALAGLGLHFDLQAAWWHLGEARRLADDFPDTKIILNHTGLPSDRSEAGLAGWAAAMRELADAPNVFVKISGLGLPDRPWRIDENAWIIRETIAIFGVERAMFASNFPVDSLCGSYATIFDGFKTATRDMTPVEQQRLFFSNAQAIYRPRLPASIGGSVHPAVAAPLGG